MQELKYAVNADESVRKKEGSKLGSKKLVVIICQEYIGLDVQHDL